MPGIVVALTGDASGALKALGATDRALVATSAKARTADRDLSRLGSGLGASVSAMARPITAATAALSGMTSAASGALKAVAGLGSKLASVGAMAGAAMMGAVAAAAQQDPGAAKALASFQATATALAVEVSRIVLPALRAVTQTIADLTAWFRSLAPELKASIGSWAAFAFQAAAVVGVASKLAGAIGSMAAFVAPILPLAAALGLAALSAGALYKSLKDATGLDVSSFTSAWMDFASTMLGIYTKLAAGWLHLVNIWRETLMNFREDIRDMFRELGGATIGKLGVGLAGFVAPSQAALAGQLAAPGARQLGEGDLLKQLEAKLASGFSGDDVKRAASSVGSALGDGFKHSLAGLKDLGKDFSKALGLEEMLERLKSLMPATGEGRVVGPLTPMAQDIFAVRSGAALGPGVFDVSDRGAIATMAREARLYAEGAFEHAVELEQARIAFYSAERARLPSLLQAFDVFSEGWHDAFMQLDRETRGLVATAAGAVQGMLGKAGSVFEAAAKGMEAGGPLGALVGAGGALLAGSDQAKRFTAVLDTIVQEASDTIGAILEPLVTGLGGALLAVRPLFDFLGSLLTSMLGPLEGLAAPLVALAPVFQALAATIQVVVDLLGALVGGALGVAFRGLFEVFKVVGIIITGITLGIQTVWNAIADSVNAVLGAIGDLFGADWRVLPRADTDATAAALQELTGLTYEAATAKAKETAASVSLTDAMRSTAAQLLNVPEVLRVSALRFAASRAEGLPGEMVGQPGPGGGAAPAGGGGAVPAPSGQAAEPGVTVFIGAQPLRTQMVIERRIQGDRVSGAQLDGLFRGGG